MIDKNQHLLDYSFTKVNADHHIKAVYEKNPVVTITKEVTGKWEDFGTPVFLFQITGTDYNGVRRTYYESLEMPEQFQTGQIYRKSFTMKIPAGMMDGAGNPGFPLCADRYPGSGKWRGGGREVILDTKDHDTAKATFCNTLTNYSEFSHNDVEINFFGKQVGR